jgi:hypothetical protein
MTRSKSVQMCVELAALVVIAAVAVGAVYFFLAGLGLVLRVISEAL